MPVAVLSSVGVIESSLQYANPEVKADVCSFANALLGRVRHNANPMPQHFLKEWREFAKLSQDDLAERVGTTKSVISLLENGHRGLGDKWAYKLADALDIRAGWLLDINPHEVDTDILRTWMDIKAEDRPTALRVLRQFTGTDD